MSSCGESLRAWMDSEFPESSPTLTEFSAGSFNIDFACRGQAWIIEAYWSEFGLSRIANATFGFEGAEEVFNSGEELKTRLSELLED